MSVDQQPISHVEWVPVSRLHANDYNPNHVAKVELRLLKRSILETGWTQPVVALKDGTIVDGFHRWTLASKDAEIAAVSEGMVPVVWVNLSDAERVAATVRHNRARGAHGVLPMAKIVERLIADGLSNDQIATELGMDDEEVSRLLEHRGSPQKFGEKRSLSKAWVPADKQ